MTTNELKVLQVLLKENKKHLRMDESSESLGKQVAYNAGIDSALHTLFIFATGRVDSETIQRLMEKEEAEK